MRISERYPLNKTQAELDFIDIDTNFDVPLFIDPFFLSIRNDNWSIESTRTIKSFFQRVIDLLTQGDTDAAKELFQHLHEPNATCLGMSRGTPSGRGVGRGDTDDIFESIANSRAAQSGLIQDLEDNLLFVDGFGKDKLSDMTTNIIRKHLIEYTQSQCLLHGIQMRENVPSGFYWNRQTMAWEQQYTNMLVIDNRIILFVPKGVVSFCNDYTPSKYYNHFVLNFMQNEHLRMNSALIQKKKDGTRFVTKKDLKARHPFSKDFLADFSQRNPTVLANFKTQTKTNSLTNFEIADINIRDLINHLINELQNVPSGNADATRYHRLITGVLELIFYPHLISPTLEREIHDGRKRIDILFDNAANEGLFLRFSQNMRLPCQYIMVECKNYSSDPANPELDQLSGRFSPNRGRVGFLLCRTIDNMNLFINRCQDTYRDDRGLIIPLVDEDIINILTHCNNWNSNYIETFLADRVRQIIMN
ncbi:MAG: hypothetical protein U0Y96_04095 [Candidatus Kapaibacterium sp.]